MTINFKSKKVIITIIVLVMVLPILWHKCSSLVIGQIVSWQQLQPKNVEVLNPIKKSINPTFNTTGRIEAKDSIEIIARVDGWLEHKYFDEGDTVQKGQVLFQIQPDEYRLAVQDATARVNENSAVYKNAIVEYNRAAMLIKDDMVSREYYDNALTLRNSKKAMLDAAKAQLAKAKLNLSYTTIKAPMTGRVGKAFISEGNYISSAVGKLAEIHKTSPIQVIFSVKSADYIYLKKMTKASNADMNKKMLNVDVKLKLADGSFYDKIGKIEFVDNKIDPQTGTVTFRAIFENPDEILVPGDFVNIVLVLKKSVDIMTIPQSATKTDVGTGYYVWVVEDGKAVKRNIVVNDSIDNDWVVESGLNYADKVVVKGIQDIYQSGQPVKDTPFKEENTEEKKGENK